MNQVNKRAGFWIRFLGRFIDLTIVFAILVSFSFLGLEKSDRWQFKNDWFFYIWTLLGIILISTLFIFIPYKKGWTIGMFICRIKIENNNKNKLGSIIKREYMFSITWIFLLLLVAVVINHTMINEYMQTKQKDISYSNWEVIRISIISSVSSILLLVQMIFGISTIVRKPKGSLHDEYSKTNTVWMNKYTQVVLRKEVVSIKPTLIKQNVVEWE